MTVYTPDDAFAADLAALLPQVAAAPERYRAQAMCRVSDEPCTRWMYRVDPSDPEPEYNYPASRIKLVLAIAALERINQLARDTGLLIDETTPLSYQPLFAGEVVDDFDAGEGEHRSRQPITLKRLIWRSLVASENEPSNKLYEFVGWRGLRAWAERHGLSDIRIEHRLAEFRSVDEQRWTPQIQILAGPQTIELAELRPDADALDVPTSHVGSLVVGSAYLDQLGNLIHSGMDFSTKSRFGVSAAVQVLERIVDRRFDLTDSQHDLLSLAMRTSPHLSAEPKYLGPKWSTERFKPMLSGLTEVRPTKEWLISNKIGEAYGFTSDMATVQHLPTGRTAHAAASIWCCASGVLNTDIYEYDTIGRPFIHLVAKQVGRLMIP